MSGGPLRIICVGNRFAAGDVAGSLVLDHLTAGSVPPEVEVIDGGLAGLDLLCVVEGAKRVVFVDAVVGFRGRDGVVALRCAEVEASANEAFGHDAGLPYLLRMIPLVLESPVPEMHVVGLQGAPTPERVECAATLSVALATRGERSEPHLAGK